MVSQILTLLALATTTPVEPGPGARAEARVTATIQRGVIVRSALSAPRQPGPPPVREVARACDSADDTIGRCRLIVVDLP